MSKRICVVMMAVGFCASMAQAALNATGDVDPADPATWTSSIDAYIGKTGVGAVTVDNDSDLVSKYGYLGYQPGGQGTVAVIGAGSTWTTSSPLNVGFLGSGTLDITDGGAVSSNSHGYIGKLLDSTGAVTVAGTGSMLEVTGEFIVGWQGSGTLDITGGGAVVSGYNMTYIAGDYFSTGAVTVTGAGSTWTSYREVYVGAAGDGTLDITDGGAVSGVDGVIGAWASTSVATVSGAGSIWASSRILWVASGGSGTLNITDGGTVTNTDGRIGHRDSATGVVTVSGAGSTWANSGELDVGFDGDGALNITDGGLVIVAGDLWINVGGTGDSYVNMDTNGMLAAWGQADDSIADFLLNLVSGTDEIRYWDGLAWSHITNGTRGQDYSLAYHGAGDLAGFTVLTVPEPATLSLLALGGMAALRKRRK